MKTIVLIFSALLWANTSLSQNYYNNVREIRGDGFVYVCENNGGTFYNAANQLIHVTQTWHNGQRMSLDDMLSGLKPRSYEGGDAVEPRIYAIFRDVLSPSELRVIESYARLSVGVYFDPNSGEALEVRYRKINGQGFLSIPPEKYFAIEQQIKQQISVVPTAEGRTYNYLYKGNSITGEELNRP